MPGGIVAVYSSKGGVGKTFLAANLAASLMLQTRESALLVDAGLPVSLDAAAMLGLGEAHHLDAVLTAADKTTPAMLASFATAHPSGLSVLALCGAGASPGQVTPAALDAVFSRLSKAYGWVVADLGMHYGEALEAVLDLASFILVPTTPDPLALAHAKADLDFLRRRNHPGGIIGLVVNLCGDDPRAAKDLAMGLTGREPLAAVPRDRDAAANMSGGRVYAKDHPRLEVTKALDALAHEVVKARAAGPRARQEEEGPARGLDEIKRVLHQKLLETFDLKYAGMDVESDPEKLKELREDVTRQIILLLDAEVEIRSRLDRDRIVREVLQDVLGLGLLEDMLAEASISEIMVNRFDSIYVERSGRIEPIGGRFHSEGHLMRVIERIVAPIGRKIDASTPMVDARLKDGSRVNAIIPPLAFKGAALTIRKFPARNLGPAELMELGSLGPQMEEFLRAAVTARLNVLISGGTGSGKTTLLNVLSGYIPSDERIITVEDSAELKLQKPHVITLEARPPNIEGKGEVTIRDLVRNCLRMRPDRIVVGECRGAEALDMLQAMNTGHDGSLTTIHANSAREALSRLETLVMFAGFELPPRVIREQITGALDLIVQIRRFKDGKRRIVQIAEVTGMEMDVITLGDVFEFRQEAAPAGEVRGAFVACGYIPRCLARFEERGISVPREIFWAAETAGGGARP
jgi:septum site-determining protein MinD